MRAMCACTRCALHCAAAKRPRNVSGEGAKAVLYVGTDPRSFTVLTAGRHCVDCRVQCSRAGATAAARKMVGTSSPHATRTNATHKSPTVMRPPPPPSKERAHVPTLRNITACAGTVPAGRHSHKKAPTQEEGKVPAVFTPAQPAQSVSLRKRMVSARHWTDADPSQ